MKKHKSKIITVVVILAVLAGAWFYGGNFNRPSNATPVPAQAQDTGIQTMPVGGMDAPSRGADVTPPSQTTTTPDTGAETPAPGGAKEIPEPPGTPDATEDPESNDRSGEAVEIGYEPLASGQNTAAGTVESAEQSVSVSSEVLDRYFTSPVPEGRPDPVEPQDMTVGDGSFTVYLTVRTDTILNNMNLLNREKHELVPHDGVIFPTTAVTAYEGESVFNILQREMRRARIHMVSRFTPIYNSAYIEAINNLYEFDVGELSGWMYKVNDWFPNYGASRYMLKPGDVIEWHYTCDLGRDLGEFSLVGGQHG
jgi:hypothetical protein